MNQFSPRLDALVGRLYRSASDVDDAAIRELLRNAAVSLLRVRDFQAADSCVELIRSLLVTAAELRVMDFGLASILRDEVGLLLEEAPDSQPVVAH